MSHINRTLERNEAARHDAMAELAQQADGQPARGSAAYCGCGELISETRRLAMPGVQTCDACEGGIGRRVFADWGMAE